MLSLHGLKGFDLKVLLFTKNDKPTAKEVVEYLNTNFGRLVLFEGERKDPFPEIDNNFCWDILISYISPWIIPKAILNRTKLWNINFHPGPPEYPGIGCFNFAIYNAVNMYGVTAHLMNEKVDTGKLLGVKYFPLLKSDSVHALSIKSYENMLSLFYEVMDFILENKSLPRCDKVWQKTPYRRSELEDLCRITPDMTKTDIKRRIKATTYPGMPGPYVELYGNKFEFNPDR